MSRAVAVALLLPLACATGLRAELVDRSGIVHFRLGDPADRPARVGEVRYTRKDGIIHEAKEPLADVERMVERASATSR